MIEIEKKFSLTKEQENNLIKDAEFISEKEIIDIYFDNKMFDLTKKDIWLRERNNQFELKVSKNLSLERKVDQYDEIEDDDKIRKFLKLPTSNSLNQDLVESGYVPFATLKTNRTKFKNGHFNIDIDEVTSKDFFCGLVEIETMVDKDSDIEDAGKRICDFAKAKGLKTDKNKVGKLIEYIKQKRPEHFKILVESKVVKQ